MSTEITKPISPMEEFQENLKKSLRDDIARMLPDAAVKEMIERVVREEFFTKRKVREPGSREWDNKFIEKGTVFQDIVMEHAKPILEALAKEWLKENQSLLVQQWHRVVDEGLLQYVENLQRGMATDALRTTLRGFYQELNNERAKQGLPTIATFF